MGTDLTSLETVSYVDYGPPTPSSPPRAVSPYPASPRDVSPYPPVASSQGLLSPDCNTNWSYATTISQPASPYEPVASPAFSPAPPAAGDNSKEPAPGKTSRRKRERKVKLYERDEPLSDPEEEKKRLNAINAKANRDKHKNKLNMLEEQVKSLTAERDALKTTNTKLVNRCDAFEKQLREVCQR